MCGIAGIVDLSGTRGTPSREALLRMAASLAHRGPDEFGLYRDARAGLAHARLSVIDLATGQQPLCDEQGALWIVFNGEIFNHVELRAELERLGRPFRTRSDTEVIVQAYRAWGDHAFARMNGQWALALWDEPRKRLVLARDQPGILPLYFCEHRGRVHFASEVKAIFAGDHAIPRALDPAGLDQTFTFWTVVPPQSVFRGIGEVRPGHLRVYEGDKPAREYPYPVARPVAAPCESVDAAAQTVRAALEKATRLRTLRADVAVGSYLSGGLDSSLVAALAQRCSGARLQTFSLRFADAEYDETSFQRLMARRLGTEHHEVMVNRRDIARIFPEVIYHAERPLLRCAPAPLYLLSRLVRQHGIKVVLTGEGADEMFAGYDLFREGKVLRFWARFPESTMRPRALERLYPYLARSPVAQQAMARRFFGRDLANHRAPGFAHGTRWQTTSALKRLFSADVHEATAGRNAVAEFLDSLPHDFARWDALAQDQHIEMRTLLSGYLLASQGDRMLMANSIEGRFPFLDPDVIALAHSLPPAYKLRVLDEKHVVKRAAKGLVADEILSRKKQPYRVPDAVAFMDSTRPDYIDEVLSEASLDAAGVFAPEAVSRLWEKCRSQTQRRVLSNADNMAFVGVLSTQLLHHQYVRTPPSDDRQIVVGTDIDRTVPTPRRHAMHDAVPLLHDYLSHSARRDGDKVALVCRKERWTYGDLDRCANALAHTMVECGVARGDRVMVFADNMTETVVAFWAALKASAIICIVSPLTKADKLEYLVGDCRPALLVVDARLHATWSGPCASPHVKRVIVAGDLADDKAAGVAKLLRWQDAITHHDGGPPPPRHNIDIDLAAIIYTSGSTGDPKGVMLTHRNMLTAATSISSYLAIVSDDVILGALPMSFDYGLYQMIMAFRQGARLVLEASFTFPAQVLKLMEDEGVTGFPGVPTIFAILAEMKTLSSFDLSKVRFVTNTAAALPAKHITALQRMFPGARIYSMYGLTECKRCTYLPPEDIARKPGSVGIAIPNTELWIVDEGGRELPPNTVGQLVIRGATVMMGYWEKAEATAEKLKPGPLPGEQVLYTGDYCRLDEEGYLYFVARMDDVIKSRGEKVAPKEVEAVLFDIEGVKEAAVIGVPDELLGQAVKAFIVLEDGVSMSEKEIQRHCQRRLESFVVPKHVEFVAGLPRTTTGKISKAGLA